MIEKDQEIKPRNFYSKKSQLTKEAKFGIYKYGHKDVANSLFNPRSNPLFKKLNMLELDHEKGVFSFEKDKNGKRFFFIDKYWDIYQLYRTLNKPHVYEVIVEDRPCHLYFDVEYHFDEHPDCDGDGIVNKLINTVYERLHQVFGIDQSSKCELIHLDATSPTKFSRHLIFRSDHFCFKNNRHVSTFVHNEILSDPELSLLVDPAVYSRNRNFRCVWSTKYANDDLYPLLPLDKAFHEFDSESDKLAFFKKSLITNVGANPNCLEYPEQDLIKWNTGQNTMTVSNGYNGTIIIPSDLNCMGIEQFALSVFAPNAIVKKAQYSVEFNTITFLIQGCRFCHRIEREHKSNSIYLVARLTSGTLVQKCFDPDCRGYESNSIKIPEQILNDLISQYTNNPKYAPEKILQPKPVKQMSFLSDSDDY